MRGDGPRRASGTGGVRRRPDATRGRASAAPSDLELSGARLEAILESARDGIVCIDGHGVVTRFNRAAERTFGYAASEVLGRNVSMLMPEPYASAHDRYIESYRRTGEARAIGRIRDVHARRKDGTVFPVELSVSEARVGGRETTYTAIVRDVSERLAMQRQLEMARRVSQEKERLADIGAVTARIAHDLGNPLAGISMQARLIERRSSRNPDRPAGDLTHPATRIVEEVARLDRLVKELMDFARQQRLDLELVDLDALVDRVVALWRPVATGRSLVLDRGAATGLTVRADREKLHRVLDNLVKNALEAIAAPPGCVTVAVETSPHGGARVTVSDTGAGIPADVDVFRLFETTKRSGSGLGLPIARQIVHAHGGEIGFERGTPLGTRFFVDLPRPMAVTPADAREGGTS